MEKAGAWAHLPASVLFLQQPRNLCDDLPHPRQQIFFRDLAGVVDEDRVCLRADSHAAAEGFQEVVDLVDFDFGSCVYDGGTGGTLLLDVEIHITESM